MVTVTAVHDEFILPELYYDRKLAEESKQIAKMNHLRPPSPFQVMRVLSNGTLAPPTLDLPLSPMLPLDCS